MATRTILPYHVFSDDVARYEHLNTAFAPLCVPRRVLARLRFDCVSMSFTSVHLPVYV